MQKQPRCNAHTVALCSGVCDGGGGNTATRRVAQCQCTKGNGLWVARARHLQLGQPSSRQEPACPKQAASCMLDFRPVPIHGLLSPDSVACARTSICHSLSDPCGLYCVAPVCVRTTSTSAASSSLLLLLLLLPVLVLLASLLLLLPPPPLLLPLPLSDAMLALALQKQQVACQQNTLTYSTISP